MRPKLKEQIEGYQQVINEIEILRKYAHNRKTDRGQVAETINRYHPKTLELVVSEKVRETDSTSTLRLVSRSGYLPPFQAGQYVNVFTEVSGIRTSRPYSISSSPAQTAFYDITIRRVADGFVSVHLLDELEVGMQLVTTSPAGNFYYNPLFHGDDLVFIAGGSGITPFMSMIREVSDKNLDRKIHLIYGNRVEEDIVFADELRECAERHPNFTYDVVISEPAEGYGGHTGFITRELIQSRVRDTDSCMFYVCGPEAMYAFVLKELEALSVPPRRLRVEVFGPPADITKQPGWPSGVKGSDIFNVKMKNGNVIKASAHEPLMNSLERSKIVIPASCRSGECSLCRTKLLSGKVFQPPGVKMRRSDAKYSYIHPCMAYPLEDLELLLQAN